MIIFLSLLVIVQAQQIAYKVSRDRKTWSESLQVCEDWGGSLVSIHDANENVRIAKLMENGMYWIGLSEMYGEGKWSWSDSS